jgi:hypothetical protein
MGSKECSRGHKIKEGVTNLDISHLYPCSITIPQHNPERINASVPSRQDFQNSVVLNDRVKVGLLTCQTFTNSQFHFLIVVESAASNMSLCC